ncbi:hypothetical protein Q8G41_27630, partial [Klebsiella pneumoniae]|uniref:hypothetical protein n=1 Tax=Klebsiella pneumoniae TaxID=573 RepID=UPI0030134A00
LVVAMVSRRRAPAMNDRSRRPLTENHNRLAHAIAELPIRARAAALCRDFDQFIVRQHWSDPDLDRMLPRDELALAEHLVGASDADWQHVA